MGSDQEAPEAAGNRAQNPTPHSSVLLPPRVTAPQSISVRWEGVT